MGDHPIFGVAEIPAIGVQLTQETPADERAAIEYVLDGSRSARGRKSLLQAETENDGVRRAALHGRFEAIDGYTAKSRAGQLLHGLGFVPMTRRGRSPFTGWLAHASEPGPCAHVDPNLLFVDEPTNHLDLDAVIWLENWLRAYPGTLLLISHDRDFLDSVTSHIAHFRASANHALQW